MAESDTSPSPFCFPEWQAQYKAALLETNRAKLLKCVAAAELAILSRLQALVGKADSEQERTAMDDALHALRFLRTFQTEKGLG